MVYIYETDGWHVDGSLIRVIAVQNLVSTEAPVATEDAKEESDVGVRIALEVISEPMGKWYLSLYSIGK